MLVEAHERMAEVDARGIDEAGGEDSSSRAKGTERPRRGTAQDMIDSGLFGAWKDLIGDEDTLSFARKLRKRAQERHWDDPEMKSYLKQALERLSLEE